MFSIFKQKSIYFIAAILTLVVSIFAKPPFIFYGVLLLSIIGMFPLFRDVYEKAFLKKISLKLPLIITILLLIFLHNYVVAAIFLILILFGGIFKDYILLRVEESIKSISKSLPHTVTLRRGEQEVVVSIENIQKEDVIIIKAGGRVPVDGILLTQGEVYFDESVVTGESRAIKKEKGDSVIAGAILSDGYVEIQATGTAADSTIAQIEALVRNSQKEQAKLSTFTTRYAFYTIVFTLLAMGVYFIFTHDILQTLALWIALVPVIFAIIVPVATTIGISILARNNVLVRNAKTFENLTKIKTIVFDKTGTLTEGKPKVVRILSYQGFSPQEVLQFAFSLEKRSEHPFARAVVLKGEEEQISPLQVEDFKTVKGKGVLGNIQRKSIVIGDGDFMEELGIDISHCLSDVSSLQAEEVSVFYISYGGVCVGIVAIADTLRDGIKEMVETLHQQGIETIMLTGDNQVVAEAIAQKLSLDRVYAHLSPEDKNRIVKEIQEQGKKVLMIGDGINDAPALAQADVGLAMGEQGIGLTLNSADIILPHNNILRIPYMFSVAKKVFRIIKLDLWVATLIHVFTAILVIFNTIDVLGSTILHQFSSVFVLVNTMRIFKIPDYKETQKESRKTNI